MEEADTEDRMRARVRASGWSLPLAGASATCYSLYGKSPSRDVDDRQNISSTSRASPAVFSPHWWPVCLGQVWCGRIPDWQNVLTGAVIPCAAEEEQPTLAVAELLAHFPVALLVAERS
jgi:hypothetical protein